MNKKYIICYLLSAFFGIVGCSKRTETKEISEPVNNNMLRSNAIYHWKTQFQLKDCDKQFLQKHAIKKMYLKFFDVDFGQDKDGVFKAIPIATTLFHDSIPTNIEIVPTVYITTKAIAADSKFAHLMYKRIMAMAKRNKINNIREIQVDCDWTRNTQTSFFKLCQDLRYILHKDSIRLSATIRLHQLKMTIPPVDGRVLMLYNTGSLYNPNTNSILSYKDVEPYLKSKIKYDLPLDYAFPIYSWGILMRHNQFHSILHKTDFTDTLYYKNIDDNKYRVLKEHYVEGHHLEESDIIRLETSPLEEIIKVKQLVYTKIKQKPYNIILYHLDSLSLAQYSPKNIDLIYKNK